jgi:tRNA threonylcarbamoyl adenosine modification protein (Sua5/YciO/YrdC/YwlC family)
MAALIAVNPYHPEAWLIKQAVAVLRRGELAVIPTDTVYAIVGTVESKETPARLNRLKGVDAQDLKKPLSVLFPDLAAVSDYTRGMPNSAFRMMKRVLPGPYTFILQASKRIPAAALQGRKTIGVRIPGHAVTLALLRELESPLIATSVLHDDEESHLDDPVQISTRLGSGVALVVDVGPLFPEPSTVVDISEGEAVVVRVGKGDPNAL